MERRRIGWASPIACIAIGASGIAQVGERTIDAQEAKLRPTSAVNAALLGHAVAIEGSIAVVGAPLDDNVSGTDAGAAYVFQRVGAEWREVALLVGSAASDLDLVGESVAIGEGAIVVGSYLEDTAGFNGAGAAYVFVECGGGWVEAARLVHSSPAPGDQFGAHVCVVGNTIAVGSPYDDTSAVNVGSTHLFERDDAGTPNNPCDDTWSLTAVLEPANGQATSNFGASIDMDGTRIVVGAPGEDGPDTNRGAVYVFEQGTSTWAETAHLAALDGAADDQFGHVIALEGDTLLVGARMDDEPQMDRGSVYAFRALGGSWALEEKLIAADGARADLFGTDIAVDGDLAVIGAPGDDDAGYSSGSAYLYRRIGTTWTQEQKLTAADAGLGDEFGISVSIDGSHALVGAQRDDGTLQNSGSAFVFELSIGNFARFGFGDGLGSSCPCDNDSAPGLEQGCANSTGSGGKLSIAGSDSATADDLRFVAWNLLPANPALLFSGPVALVGGSGQPFGNGLRLVGGALVRRSVVAPDQEGHACWGPGLGGKHAWVPDTTIHFQAWYRDPFHSGCYSSFNFTNGLTVTFQR